MHKVYISDGERVSSGTLISRSAFFCLDELTLGGKYAIMVHDDELSPRGTDGLVSGFIYKLHDDRDNLYRFINSNYFNGLNHDDVSAVLADPISSIKDVKKFLVL